MKVEMFFDNLPEYVLLQASEEASVDGIEKMLRQLVDSPNWKIGTKQIIDHRELIVKTLTSNDMRKIRDIIKRYSDKLGNGRCAFVVKDALGFGLARMYDLIGGDHIHSEVGVFYTLEEARDWLKD